MERITYDSLFVFQEKLVIRLRISQQLKRSSGVHQSPTSAAIVMSHFHLRFVIRRILTRSYEPFSLSVHTYRPSTRDQDASRGTSLGHVPRGKEAIPTLRQGRKLSILPILDPLDQIPEDDLPRNLNAVTLWSLA